MPLTKRFLKHNNTCRVTFKIPKELGKTLSSAAVVGEFNSWNPVSAPMNKNRDGSFVVSLDLEPGREYQLRYLLDGTTWDNEGQADRYCYSPFGNCDNSVVAL